MRILDVEDTEVLNSDGCQDDDDLDEDESETPRDNDVYFGQVQQVDIIRDIWRVQETTTVLNAKPPSTIILNESSGGGDVEMGSETFD